MDPSESSQVAFNVILHYVLFIIYLAYLFIIFYWIIYSDLISFLLLRCFCHLSFLLISFISQSCSSTIAVTIEKFQNNTQDTIEQETLNERSVE